MRMMTRLKIVVPVTSTANLCCHRQKDVCSIVTGLKIRQKMIRYGRSTYILNANGYKAYCCLLALLLSFLYKI